MEGNIKAPTSEISAKDIVIHIWRLSVYRSKSNKCNKVFLLSRALIAKVNTRGVLPYISHIGMCRPKGHGFAHFGLESGMVYEGTTGVFERIYRFNYSK